MELFIWSAIFVVSVIALLRGAAWFASAAAGFFSKRAAAGFAAIAIGAALPELSLALVAVLTGRPELVLPIVLGSSIVNILLVSGLSAIAARNLPINREYADLDAPLLAASTAIFYFCAADGQIVFLEGMLMFLSFLICAVFLAARGRIREFTPRDIVRPGMFGAGRGLIEMVGSRFSRGFNAPAKIFRGALLLGLGGALLLAIAADFTVESLAGIAALVALPATVLALSVLAIVAAMPELWASVKIIAQKRYEVAMGNVFASTTVNLLLVAGIAAMFSPLPVDVAVLEVALPFFIAAGVLLTVSAFSRKINAGQGWLYLFFYLLFLAKLLNWF